MNRYLLQRLLLVLPTLLIANSLVFGVLRIIPADAAVIMLGSEGLSYTPENLERLREQLGLTQPLPVQYLGFWANVAQGNLGRSLWTKQPVLDEIGHRLPATLELSALGLLLAWLWGIGVGVVSARHQDRWPDHLSRSVAIAGLSVPSFASGILVLVVSATLFGWTPIRRFANVWEDPIANLTLMVFPAVILGFSLGAPVMRLTRATMLDVLRQDYVLTARAKGLHEQVVIGRHVLRNSLIPVVTLLGVQAVLALGGAVILETLFNIPGMGRLLIVEALAKRDYPMVQGITFVMAAMTVGVNLLIDITYGLLDPRVRYQ